MEIWRALFCRWLFFDDFYDMITLYDNPKSNFERFYSLSFLIYTPVNAEPAHTAVSFCVGEIKI